MSMSNAGMPKECRISKERRKRSTLNTALGVRRSVFGLWPWPSGFFRHSAFGIRHSCRVSLPPDHDGVDAAKAGLILVVVNVGQLDHFSRAVGVVQDQATVVAPEGTFEGVGAFDKELAIGIQG